MLRWFLFGTRLGDVVLTTQERPTGLGVVDVSELGLSEVRIIGARERVSAF